MATGKGIWKPRDTSQTNFIPAWSKNNYRIHTRRLREREQQKMARLINSYQPHRRVPTNRKKIRRLMRRASSASGLTTADKESMYEAD